MKYHTHNSESSPGPEGYYDYYLVLEKKRSKKVALFVVLINEEYF